LLVTALLFWCFTFDDKSHRVAASVSLREQLATLKDPRVWRYCQYYSIVFGGYVALALWMTQYYVAEYGFSLQGAALLAACFSLPGGVLRALGGWMSDRWGAHSVTWWVLWVSWVCLFLLSYPQTDLTLHTLVGRAGRLASSGLPSWLRARCDLNVVRSTNSMLLYGVVWASLSWMYLSEVRRTPGRGTPRSDS